MTIILPNGRILKKEKDKRNMRKGIATLIKNGNKIENLTITLSNGDNIPFIYHDSVVSTGYHDDKGKPIKYESIRDMIEHVLALCKQNDIYLPHYNDFGLTWYAINFIDFEYPNRIKHYGYERKAK